MLQFDDSVTVGRGFTHTDFTRENRSRYSFFYQDAHTAEYKNKADGSKLVVVFANDKWLEDFVAVLKGNDVDLYERLNLGEDSSRGNIGDGFILMGTIVILTTVLSLVLALSAPSLHLLWQIPLTFPISVVLLVLYLFARHLLIEKYRFFSLARDILFSWRNEFNVSHHKRLLRRLTFASDRVRAGNAKKLLRYL